LPVLVWESALFDDLALTGLNKNIDWGTQSNQQSISITDTGPLSAGLSGNVQVAASNQLVRWGNPSSGAMVTSSVIGDASKATIFSYEAGAPMLGMTAPGRRVGFFFSNSIGETWTTNGQLLFDAAVAWLLAAPGGGNQPPVANAGPDRNATANVQTTLNGGYSDDGVALPVTSRWTVLDSPAGGSAEIDNLNDPQSTVTFTLPGQYRLELQIDDPDYSDSDEVVITVGSASSVKEVLFVSRTFPVDQADERMLYQLEQILGLNVEVVSQSGASASNANGKDAVIISSTVSSTAIGNKFTNVSAPLLTWEAWLLDDLGMVGAGSFGREFNQTVIDVVDSGHPIAAGKSGDTTISSAPSTVTYGVPLASADVIAVSPSLSNRARIFTYSPGDQLTTFQAPEKRAFFYIYQDGHVDWTADAQDLFNTTVKWLLGLNTDPQLRIMPIGDSITRGKNSTWSYRQTLSSLLNSDQCSYDIVGTEYGADSPTPPSPGLFDRDHEGHGGFRTDQIDAAINGYLPGNVPDAVLIHLGTNDITQGANLADAQDSIRSIIAKLRSYNPQVVIFLAKLIKRHPAYDSTIANYNDLMSELASDEDTLQSPVILVDQFTGYDNSIHNQSDNLHPNDLGDAFIANKWFDAMRPEIGTYCAL
jgi:hypothetical protein